MKEFTCVVCGKKGIDKSSGRGRKFCSNKCACRYWNLARNGGYKGDEACVYNEGVSCIIHKCKKCGWNPDVAKKRMEALA